jgi:hypothetical protein
MVTAINGQDWEFVDTVPPIQAGQSPLTEGAHSQDVFEGSGSIAQCEPIGAVVRPAIATGTSHLQSGWPSLVVGSDHWGHRKMEAGNRRLRPQRPLGWTGGRPVKSVIDGCVSHRVEYEVRVRWNLEQTARLGQLHQHDQKRWRRLHSIEIAARCGYKWPMVFSGGVSPVPFEDIQHTQAGAGGGADSQRRRVCWPIDACRWGQGAAKWGDRQVDHRTA